MSFIARIIGPDEKKIGVVAAHWIYGAKGFAFLLACLFTGWAINHYAVGFLMRILGGAALPYLISLSNHIMLIALAIGGLVFMFYCIKMLATEIGLTNRRVILKTGLLMVDVKEIDIEEIKAADVDNGWLGRIFNYGYIKLDSRFVKDIGLAAIGDPYRFVKALNEARTILAEDSMHIVLEEGGAAAKEQLAHNMGRTPEVHAIGESRYQSLEVDSIKAAAHIGQDVKQTLHGMSRPGEDIAIGIRNKPQGGDKNEGQPIVFRKEIMRKDFKSEFCQTA